MNINISDLPSPRDRWGLLLVNLGTPDSTSVTDVRRYLREFLSDPRVLDIPSWRRWLLLNLLILPFRPKASAAAYRQVWQKEGSPLLLYSQALADCLRRELGESVPVELGMRYQNPSIASALGRLRQARVDRIVVLPLFPQYSSAAWGSGVEKVFVEASKHWNVPAIEVIPPFYDHPAFIAACAQIAKPVLDDLRPEKILMSFHGLPERHVIKSDESCGQHCLQSANCCDSIVPANRSCYRAQCFATARAIARALSLDDEVWEVTFQSRLGRSPWIKPYTDLRIVELAKSGVKRVGVLSPSFVADCLETLEEIGIRGAEDFRAHGGETLRLIPSLNGEDVWVKGVLKLISESSVGAM